MDEREHWMRKGNCRGKSLTIFFPAHGENVTAEAKVICGECDVTSECLEYALRLRIKYGVWGGLGYPQRKHIYRKRQTAARRALQAAS